MKKFFLSIFILVFFSFVLAQISLDSKDFFGYSEVFLFKTGENQTKHLIITGIIAGESGMYYVRIFNPMSHTIQVKLDFFDQISGDDGMNYLTCSPEHSSDDFGTYMSWSDNVYTLTSGEYKDIPVQYQYPYCFDGWSKGCVVVYDSSDPDAGIVGVVNFVDLSVSRNIVQCDKYSVFSIPSFRSSNFRFTGFMSYRIADDISLVNVNNANNKGLVNISSDGTGQFFYTFPKHGSGFVVVFKPYSYLSVGYTGIFDLYGTGKFDFIHQTYLDNWIYFSGRYDRVYMDNLPEVLGGSGERSLLVAGDLNNNDYIGAADLALINYYLTVNFDPVPFAYDMDNDGYITSKDQAILINNVTRNGFRRYLKNLQTSGYLVGDDLDPGAGEYPWN